MIQASIAALLLAQAPVAAAPQSPVAAGPLNSILKVIRIADSCGVRQLRLDSNREESLAPARLYLDGEYDQSDAEVWCLERWLTENGKRLRLMPRWWKDDFTKDRP